MKGYNYLLIVCCILICACKAQKPADNDLAKMNLHGSVRILTEKDYYLDTAGEKKGKILRWTKIYSFSKDGYLTEKSQYDDKGELSSRYTYAYDDSNHLLEEKVYGDTLLYTITHKYDAAHHDTAAYMMTTEAYAQGYLLRCEYNKQGQLTTKVMSVEVIEDEQPADGRYMREYEEHYGYNNAGDRIQCHHVDADSFVQTITYTYDDHHNCTSEVADTALPHHVKRTARTYDEKGNELTEISYEADGSIHSQTKKEYGPPDAAGNWLMQYIHWKDLGTTLLERNVVYYNIQAK